LGDGPAALEQNIPLKLPPIHIFLSVILILRRIHIVLQEDLDLVVHLVSDIKAADASNDAHHAKGYGTQTRYPAPDLSDVFDEDHNVMAYLTALT